MIDVFVSKPLINGMSLVKKAEVGEYTDYYKLIECSAFDVVRVEWKGEEISIYVDDEGLLKNGNLGRAVHGYPEPLFGIFVITGGVDNYGRTLSVPETIKEDDVYELIGKVQYIVGD